MARQTRMKRYVGIMSREVFDMITNSEPIEIRVGVEIGLRTRHVPQKLLTNTSTFFAAALDGNFAEQSIKLVTLPEVAAEDFEGWIQWLYLGVLSLRERYGFARDYQKELVRLWSLGEMLGCPKFQDVAFAFLDANMSTKDPGMRPESLAFIWETCAHGSRLRKFAVDRFADDVRMGRFRDDAEDEEAFTQFAEENEDFAKEYTAASIWNGGRKWPPQTLYETYVSSP